MRKTVITIVVTLLAAAAARAVFFLVGDPFELLETPFYGKAGVDADRCQELILASDGIVAGTISRWEWRSGGEAGVGQFYKFRILLCPTPRAALGETFQQNYGGRTPVEVARGDPMTVTIPAFSWFGFDLAPTFNYNGADNLIVEVWWEGDDGGGAVVFGAEVPGQERGCYARVVNGVPMFGYPDAGKVTGYLHYMRLTISPAAVEPSSLGRVKTFYR